MISERMSAAISEQINAEVFSSYLYLSMSAAAADMGLNGVANWMSVQVKEELTHAQRFLVYLTRVGSRVQLKAIDAPEADFASVLEIFEKTLDHERKVTRLINSLVTLAREEQDHATEIFLQWFVNEQVEEEETAADIVSQLKLAGGEGGGLFMIDRELGQRVFTPPADMGQG